METPKVATKVKWDIDPSHSEIAFMVKHLMISNVRGVFKEFNASVLTIGEGLMNSEVDFMANPASIDTGDQKRDKHLKSADFFDVNIHKQITFKGFLYEKIGKEGSFELAGDLTIKEISKHLKLDVEFGGIMKDPWGNEKAGFAITGKISRKEWGLIWNSGLEAGGVLVGDEVVITCDVQFVKNITK